MQVKRTGFALLGGACAAMIGAAATPAMGVVSYDEDLTPNFIGASGVDNGFFTVDRANGVEIGIRGKLRFNSSNQPENTFNSNGDGTYSFAAGQAPGGFSFSQPPTTTPVWSFDWGVNSDWDGSSGWNLDDLTYEMGLDFDPGPGTNFQVFDPITGVNPGLGTVQWDHAIGDNSTPQGGGTVIPNNVNDPTGYATLLANNNVAQNSWNYEFFNEPPYDFFDPNIVGAYDIYLKAFDGATEVASITITILVTTDTKIIVVPTSDWCSSVDVNDPVSVDLNLQDAQDDVAGASFLVAYNADKLQYDGALAGDGPFNNVIVDLADPFNDNDGTGTDYAFVAVGLLAPIGGTSADTRMATLDFTVLDEFCFETDLVVLEAGDQPLWTRLTDELAETVPHTPVNLEAQTVDDTPPSITCPADVVVNADAGSCDALLSFPETFDDPVQTGSQAPGVWYVDRYAPAVFTNGVLSGENVLRHGVDAADGPGNRPGSFSSTFYNTQGRKYDVDMPMGSTIAADFYLPSGFDTNVRSFGLWGTTRDSFGNISGYPILSFASNDPADPLNTSPANPTPRFQFYTQDTDQNPGNGYDPDYVALGAPPAYDEWYRFEIDLTATSYEARVIRLSTDTVIYTFSDAITFGSVIVDNIILQVYNFGETYEMAWDNVTLGPEGPAVSDNCSDVVLTYERSDNAALTLADPFPVGTTTITWTATDGCGNSDFCEQDVTVNDVSDLVVNVELDGTVDAGPFDRCITFTLWDCDGSATDVASAVMTFTNGMASATIDVPCGEWDCITARDDLHTLISTDDDDFGVVGSQYVADFTGGDALIGGNLNQDAWIDILDFGGYVGQYGLTIGADTDCNDTPIHADFSGDGVVGTGDFTFISNNFLVGDDDSCCTLSAPFAGGPVESITVTELHRRGLHRAALADLNGDGVLDVYDVVAFLNGNRPSTGFQTKPSSTGDSPLKAR